VSDGSFNEFNVIVCRNVLIYFGRELQDQVHDLFFESLVASACSRSATRDDQVLPAAGAYEELDGIENSTAGA